MSKKFLNLTGYQWVWVLYLAVAVYCWLFKYFRHIDNNYLIFRQAYYHARAGVNLYLAYPAEYYDIYYYGPTFTILVAPFAIPSEAVGFFLWQIVNALAFLLAVHMLPFSKRIKTAILLLSVIEFANTSHYMQMNAIVAACIIFSFIMVKRGKDEWATLFTVAGALVKFYPIVGLSFFFFSKNKLKFVVSTMAWSLVMFALPMLISSSAYVVQSYHEWFAALSAKNSMNVTLDGTIDWCIMGVVRRFTANPNMPNTPFLIAGAIIFATPLLRFKQYASLKFQFQVMCSALMMVVLFSTGSEHPTFIIATAGAVIYIMMQEKPFSTYNIILLILLLVVTGLSPSDAFPRPLRVWMNRYAMKAIPCIIIWFQLAYELIFKDFLAEKPLALETNSYLIAA